MTQFAPSLTFSGAAWLWPLAILMAAALLALFWSYRAAPSGGLRWWCAGLKTLGVTALAICLLEPQWSGQRSRPGSNLFAVVADNSQGLNIHDRGEALSRGEQLREWLNPQNSGWLSTLAEHFEVRRYLFDARLQSTLDFSELNLDGRASALGSALRTLARRYQNRPLAGVLLFTDGIATDLAGSLPDLTGLPPVYPVVLGRRESISDIALQQVNVSQTEFEDAPVSVQASVQAAGFNGATIVAQLRDPAGKVVAEQSLRSRGEEDTLAFRFQVRPERPGLTFYQLRAGLREELSATRSAREATLANNSRVLVVDRGAGPYRILYVSGRPNWEFKFLNRAAQVDDQVQLVAMIRVAKREPKFEFRGRIGETGNPLFRGFDNQDRESVERYDQPVIVRLNTRDELELRGGFPRVPEDLYAYQAVILDDIEAEFFAPDQASLLQQFVSERGGGFLMLGGVESFQQGKYQRTPIGDLLPVYLDRGDPQKGAGQWHLNLSREGWLQPWARLRDNELDEKSRLQGMPSFQVLNRVREVKPGASVIATVKDEAGNELPALVAQRFGRGRSAALMIGDLWRWGLHDADMHRDMDKAWRQLLRWLVTDVPRKVELAVENAPDDTAGAVSLQVHVRDLKFQPLDNASVVIVVRPHVFAAATGAATNSIRLQAEPSSQEAGLYQATYVPRVTGGFQAIACATNSAGAEVGRAEAGWSTDLAAEEFHSLLPDTALLENLARRTGGEVISARSLADLARRLPHRQAPVMEAWSYPLWHSPILFALALACLLAEWGLRRWKGLA